MNKNPAGGGRFLYNPLVEKFLNARMKASHYRTVGVEVATRTKANAVDGDYKKTVRYSLSMSQNDGVLIYTKNPFAHLDEYGSANNSPSAAMRRAVESVGLKLR